MKIEMSHEIKSTKQPATQPVNHTNQLQKNIAQPAKRHISETTYRRNLYKLNNPRLSFITLYTNLPNDK